MLKKYIHYCYGQGDIPADKYDDIIKRLRRSLIALSLTLLVLLVLLLVNLLSGSANLVLELLDFLVRASLFILVFFFGSKGMISQLNPSYLSKSKAEKVKLLNQTFLVFVPLTLLYFYIWPGIYSSLSQGRPIWDYFSNLWVLFFFFWGFAILFGCLYMAGRNHLDDQERERQLLTPKEEKHENSTL